MATKSLNLDAFIDANPGAPFEEIMDAMIKYQEMLTMTDAKARKIVNKKKSKAKDDLKVKNMRRDVRKGILKDIEATKFLDKILDTLMKVSKAVKRIAQLMMYLISSLFCISGVRESLSKDTCGIIDTIYDKSMKIYNFI